MPLVRTKPGQENARQSTVVDIHKRHTRVLCKVIDVKLYGVHEVSGLISTCMYENCRLDKVMLDYSKIRRETDKEKRRYKLQEPLQPDNLTRKVHSSMLCSAM